MRQAAATKILAYWDSLSSEAAVPAAASVDPRALKAHLPDLFMLERLDRAVFAFRLAGTRMCQRFGRELRDHDFVRLFPAQQHGDVLAQLNRALQTGESVVIRAGAVMLDNTTVGAEIVLMPLTDAEGRVVRLLGALLPEDNDALRNGESYVALRLEAAQTGAAYGAAQEAAASAVFAAARETRVSFLRVVDGSKDDRPASADIARIAG
ncbi:MAG: PAS domain-containing protein [Micropepsaceae bacterium]